MTWTPHPAQENLLCGLEYQTCWVFEWSEVVWMLNGLVFEWHLKSKRSNHSKTGLNDSQL